MSLIAPPFSRYLPLIATPFGRIFRNVAVCTASTSTVVNPSVPVGSTALAVVDFATPLFLPSAIDATGICFRLSTPT